MFMESFQTLPIFFKVFVGFGFGVIIGSFLNVYLYRFHTGKSLAGKSHCLSCGTTIKKHDLIPLLSYLALLGKCRHCRSYIPVRYFLVELLTGLLFGLAILQVHDLFLLLLTGVLLALLVVVAVYDLYHLVIADEMIFALSGVAFLWQGYELFLTGDSTRFFYNLLTAFLGVVFFFGLWHYSSGRWIGFGDVKLAWPLGFIAGCAGVFSMIVLSFWVGAVIGIILIGLQKLLSTYSPKHRILGKQLHLKSAIPFAPFLIIGFLLVFFWQIDVISLLSYA